MIRIGQGIDFHRFGPNRKLILGGVEIDYPLGLVGHSDADLLLHALSDAILGALGLGDIGQHYSDRDPRWKDMDSSLILSGSLARAQELGYYLGNLDLTLIGEEPKLGPYRDRIRTNLARLCGLEESRINIKATTSETMGDIGKKEGLGALCIVLMVKKGGPFSGTL